MWPSFIIEYLAVIKPITEPFIYLLLSRALLFHLCLPVALTMATSNTPAQFWIHLCASPWHWTLPPHFRWSPCFSPPHSPPLLSPLPSLLFEDTDLHFLTPDPRLAQKGCSHVFVLLNSILDLPLPLSAFHHASWNTSFLPFHQPPAPPWALCLQIAHHSTPTQVVSCDEKLSWTWNYSFFTEEDS